MRLIAYLLGALVELIAQWPLRDLAGAAVLALTIGTVYVLMLLVVA